jgi:hypothetical protein
MVNVEILSGEPVEKQFAVKIVSARMLADNAKGTKVLTLTHFWLYQPCGLLTSTLLCVTHASPAAELQLSLFFDSFKGRALRCASILISVFVISAT